MASSILDQPEFVNISSQEPINSNEQELPSYKNLEHNQIISAQPFQNVPVSGDNSHLKDESEIKEITLKRSTSSMNDSSLNESRLQSQKNGSPKNELEQGLKKPSEVSALGESISGSKLNQSPDSLRKSEDPYRNLEVDPSILSEPVNKIKRKTSELTSSERSQLEFKHTDVQSELRASELPGSKFGELKSSNYEQLVL